MYEDLRKSINIITESAESPVEEGVIDRVMASLGNRAAKGRVNLQAIYKQLLGNWREYAAETGLDRGSIFSQNNFPKEEFVEFLKSQEDFDDEMVGAIEGLKGRNIHVRNAFRSAAKVAAKKARGSRLKQQDVEEPSDQQDTGQPGPASSFGAGFRKGTGGTPADTSPAPVDDIEDVFKNKLKGNLEYAKQAGEKVLANPNRIRRMGHLERLGLAVLSARGHLKKKD